jgi:hypothetical protein
VKKHLFILFVWVVNVSFAQTANPPYHSTPQPTKDQQVYEVTQNANLMSLTYIDPNECAILLEQQAQAKHWTGAQRAKEEVKMPFGGYLTISWARPTATQAAAKNFGLLVKDSKGQELKRIKLTAPMGEPVTTDRVLVYAQSIMVPLDQSLAKGARVFLIEASVGKRYEYLIRP